MSHPYKSYSEHDHGRKVADKRVKGYDSGGAIKFPGKMTASAHSGVGRLEKAAHMASKRK